MNYKTLLIDKLRATQIAKAWTSVETVATLETEPEDLLEGRLKESNSQTAYMPPTNELINDMRDDLDLKPMNTDGLTMSEKQVIMSIYTELTEPEPVKWHQHFHAALSLFIMGTGAILSIKVMEATVTLNGKPFNLPVALLFAAIGLYQVFEIATYACNLHVYHKHNKQK